MDINTVLQIVVLLRAIFFGIPKGGLLGMPVALGY